MNKTDEELKEIALGIHKGHIFTDRHVRSAQELSLVFMPLIFLKEEQIDKIKKEDIGMVYEYMDKAGPRSVNGMPCFMSMQMITEAEAKTVIGYVEKYREAEKTVA
jgi:hypothetical protein